MQLTDLTEPYINRTRIYLGNVFLLHLDYNSAHSLRVIKPIMWGVYDLKYVWAKRLKKYLDYRLFVLVYVDTDKKRELLRIVKKDKYFEDCYPLSLVDTKTQLLVFKIPRTLRKSYDRFLEGKFSEMYTTSQLMKFRIEPFEDGANNALHAVLTKNPEYKEVFEERLFKYFDVETTVGDNDELDNFYVPPTYEAFNVEHYGPMPKIE